MALFNSDPKEIEAGRKMAGLLVEAEQLRQTGIEADAAMADYKLEQVKEIETELGKKFCSCTTRDALLKKMRKEIGYGRFGLAGLAGKEFFKSIRQDITKLVS